MNRDIKLSNIKGLLILLVIFGHIISPVQEQYYLLYLFINTFHMPLFVLVSGYFAKHATFKRACNFVLLYIVFLTIYRFYLMLVGTHHTFNLDFTDPYYHLWYLISMAVWYLVATIIRKLPQNKVINGLILAALVIIGVSSRFYSAAIDSVLKQINPEFSHYTFSYQRTLTFLPFFFIGFYLTKENMQKLYHSLKARKVVTAAAILSILAYLLVTNKINQEKILKGSYGLFHMKGNQLYASVEIIIAYIIAIIMSYILLNIISKKVCFLTKWGDRSLTVYLFQAFFLKIIKKMKFLGLLNSWLLLLLLFVITIGITIFLSSDFVNRYTYYLVRPMEAIETAVKKLKPSKLLSDK